MMKSCQADTQYNSTRDCCWDQFRLRGDKNILVIWGRENRLVEVTQDGATCQASAKPQWLGNNKFYHMSVYGASLNGQEDAFFEFSNCYAQQNICTLYMRTSLSTSLTLMSLLEIFHTLICSRHIVAKHFLVQILFHADFLQMQQEE